MDLDNPDVTEKCRSPVLVCLNFDEGAVDGFSQSVLVAVGLRKAIEGLGDRLLG